MATIMASFSDAVEFGHFCGLKARHVTAWGEAQRAKPQVKVRTANPLRAESAGHRVEMMPLFCFGLSGLWGILRHPLPGPPLATLAPAQGKAKATGIIWRGDMAVTQRPAELRPVRCCGQRPEGHQQQNENQDEVVAMD